MSEQQPQGGIWIRTETTYSHGMGHTYEIYADRTSPTGVRSVLTDQFFTDTMERVTPESTIAHEKRKQKKQAVGTGPLLTTLPEQYTSLAAVMHRLPIGNFRDGFMHGVAGLFQGLEQKGAAALLGATEGVNDPRFIALHASLQEAMPPHRQGKAANRFAQNLGYSLLLGHLEGIQGAQHRLEEQNGTPYALLLRYLEEVERDSRQGLASHVVRTDVSNPTVLIHNLHILCAPIRADYTDVALATIERSPVATSAIESVSGQPLGIPSELIGLSDFRLPGVTYQVLPTASFQAIPLITRLNAEITQQRVINYALKN